ncbi:MAG TPA: PHP domain-containing protein [Clostridia bacterium]|nr:PHP domain-containing protein [Clostridia bacterium]
MKVDLHTHTTASDGVFSPRRLVKEARETGLRAVAVTDHDTINGLEEAWEEGQRSGIEVIPGIELSTHYGGAEVHILGYLIDWERPHLQEVLEDFAQERFERARKMVEKLAKLNIRLDLEEVQAVAGTGVIGRPHVARALVKAGYVRTLAEAFSRYLASGAPAYVARRKLTPARAIDLLRSVQGIPVLAHPGLLRDDGIIPDLVRQGLKGIEVYYPGHRLIQKTRYLALCGRFRLIATGGSDFHGDDGRVPMGSVEVNYNTVDRLKKLKEEDNG